MAHSLTTAPATAIAISSSKSNKPVQSIGYRKVWACRKDFKPHNGTIVIDRRNLALGLSSVLLGLSVGDRSANAASRRPPPPPPTEKKDPNVSGVQAKVLASKKRKEAMKESIAKLREKGKVIGEQPKAITSEPSEPSEPKE